MASDPAAASARPHLRLVEAAPTTTPAERPHTERLRGNLVNCTGHDIDVLLADGQRVSIPPSGFVARCKTFRARAAEIEVDGRVVPINTLRRGAVSGLPKPHPDTYYVVSWPVADAARWRTDLLIADEHERSDDRRVLGVRGLAFPSDAAREDRLARQAVPSADSQRSPTFVREKYLPVLLASGRVTAAAFVERVERLLRAPDLSSALVIGHADHQLGISRAALKEAILAPDVAWVDAWSSSVARCVLDNVRPRDAAPGAEPVSIQVDWMLEGGHIRVIAARLADDSPAPIEGRTIVANTLKRTLAASAA